MRWRIGLLIPFVALAAVSCEEQPAAPGGDAAVAEGKVEIIGGVPLIANPGEVDFVVQDRDRIIPVQVTWDAPVHRHHRALEDFYEHFPQAEEARFITAGDFQEALDELCR